MPEPFLSFGGDKLRAIIATDTVGSAYSETLSRQKQQDIIRTKHLVCHSESGR